MKRATKTATRKTRRPVFYINGQERELLALYRTVGEDTRRAVGGTLVFAWTHPAKDDQPVFEERYKRACREFRTGVLLCSVLDQVCSGAR